MSDASSVDAPTPAESPLWQRVLRTPVGELLRGRIASSPVPRKIHKQTARHILAEAQLPDELSHLVMNVADRTRLWRSERLDVMRELIAHFADGLEQGASAEELAESFGDSRESAKLIRRAKKRNRPLWWRTMRVGLWMILALIGLYGLLAIRFFIGRPTIAHNYIADIEAMTNAHAASQRAWPVYRQVLLTIGKAPSVPDDAWEFRGARPGDKHWNLAVQYVTDHAESIKLLREAAQRDALGYVISTEISEEDQALWPQTQSAQASTDPLMENAVVGVLLPYLAEMRNLAFVLAIDARRAAAEGDGETALANLSAILGMTRQLRDLPILIQDLVGNAILAMACDTAGDLIAQHPETFTDSQLQRLAHRFAAVRDSDIDVRLDGERMFFDDILQRIYTDDGQGDGRMTPGGMRVMQMLVDFNREDSPFELSDVAYAAAAPAMGVIALGRAELRGDYHALMDQFEAEAARPLWERDQSPGEQQIEQWMASPIERYRRMPLVLLAPAIGKATQTSEITKMLRDATITAIGLELYRRRHDRWPDSLDDLVPSILPSVPADRFDGKRLKYALTDDRPTLYCVGSDGDDDGGRAPTDVNGNPDNNAAARWVPPSNRNAMVGRAGNMQLTSRVPDGDWIVWPRPN